MVIISHLIYNRKHFNKWQKNNSILNFCELSAVFHSHQQLYGNICSFIFLSILRSSVFPVRSVSILRKSYRIIIDIYGCDELQPLSESISDFVKNNSYCNKLQLHYKHLNYQNLVHNFWVIDQKVFSFYKFGDQL